MKRLALLIASLFFAGLFTSGTALGMSHEDKAMDEKKGSAEYQHPTLGEASDPLAARDLDEDQIRELESILQDEGYEIGQADGRLGLEDQEALRQFQQEQGLVVTGEPNEETLRALSTDVEQQEFFGLSPEFGPGEEGVLQDDQKLKEQQQTEEPPTLDQRIEEKPETKSY